MSTPPAGTFTQVSSGQWNACGVRTDATVACWGHNEYDEAIPLPGTFRQYDLGSDVACGVRSDGSLACRGDDVPGFMSPPPGTFTHVGVGSDHACALGSEGAIVCWGEDLDGRLDAPAGTFTHVSVGDRAACAVRTDGSITCWGTNVSGQSSPPDGSFRRPQVDAGLGHTCGLADDGTVSCWGLESSGSITGLPSGPYAQISAGGTQTCALASDATTTCWGFLGDLPLDPPAGSRFVHVDTGGTFSCGLRPDATALCWGASSSGQLNVPAGTYTQVSAGLFHGCGVRTGGAVACWGFDREGETMAPAGTFTQVSAGNKLTCGLRTDGTVACWGAEDSLGEIDVPAGTFTQVSVGDGQLTVCGLGTDGTVACWGVNVNGEAESLPGTFASIDVGSFHSCGVRTDGTVACWGASNDGRKIPIVISAVPPAGAVGVAYSHAVTTTLVLPAPTFTLVDGTLPPGVTLAPNGTLTGTPTTTGTFGPITVSAANRLSPPATQTFSITIDPAPTTTLLSSSANPSTYGDTVVLTATVTSAAGTPTGTVTIDGCGPVALDGAGQATCSRSGLGVGDHESVATYGGAGIFAPSSHTLTQTVEPATVVVTAPSGTKVYGDPLPELAPPTYSGLLNGDTGVATPATCSTDVTVATPVGSRPVTCSGAADPNYSFEYVPGTLAVTPATLKVVADAQTRPFGVENPPLTTTISGFVLGETLATSDVTGAPACSTAANTTSPPGDYLITCKAGTLRSGNYTFAFVDGMLTVARAETTLAARPASALGSLLALRVTYSATLTDTVTGEPVSGETVSFRHGSVGCGATTDANGVATCSTSLNSLLAVLLGQPYTATFVGSPTHLPSSTTGASELL